MVFEGLQATIGIHTVRLTDNQPVDDGGDVRVDGPVRIIVDGGEYSHPALAKIRLAQRDANRYWGYVYLMRLRDQQTGTEHLVVAQNIGQGQFRTVSIGIDGLVEEDRFDYSGRCSPPVRALLIRWVVSHPSGFCSDVMQVWPSIFYPVLYPWATGVVGLAFLVAGGVLKLRRRGQPAASNGSHLQGRSGAW